MYKFVQFVGSNIQGNVQFLDSMVQGMYNI